MREAMTTVELLEKAAKWLGVYLYHDPVGSIPVSDLVADLRAEAKRIQEEAEHCLYCGNPDLKIGSKELQKGGTSKFAQPKEPTFQCPAKGKDGSSGCRYIWPTSLGEYCPRCGHHCMSIDKPQPKREPMRELKTIAFEEMDRISRRVATDPANMIFVGKINELTAVLNQLIRERNEGI